MKSSTIIAFFCLLLGFSACKKDDDSSNNNSNSTTTGTQPSGVWRISNYSDSGNNETYHFTGYTFVFNSNGSIVATKNAVSLTGTWRNGVDDSKSKLYLDFGTVTPFDELNEDWHILEQTSSKIRLQHISGGNGGIDLLTFER